ncbi:MAG: YraN family protein [Hyphomonadaceae bacterium]|nr:YraN family protein [Hyphomonadaceae bacterium]
MKEARQPKRRLAEARGRRAELVAMLWLMAKGYRILGRRCRTPFGEVDLAAMKSGVLAIVEVKARDSEIAGQDALGARQQERLGAAALALAKRWRLERAPIRYDLMVVGVGPLPVHRRGVWGLDRPF